MTFDRVPQLARISLIALLAGITAAQCHAQQSSVPGITTNGKFYPSSIQDGYTTGPSACGINLYTPSSSGHWQHQWLRLPSTSVELGGVQSVNVQPRRFHQFIRFTLVDPHDSTYRYPIEKFARSSYTRSAVDGHHYQCFQAYVHLESEAFGPEYDDSIQYGDSDLVNEWPVALPNAAIGQNQHDTDGQATPLHTVPRDEAWGVVDPRYAYQLGSAASGNERLRSDLYQLIVEFDIWCNDANPCQVPTEFFLD